jgi:hypothetical protein
VVVVMVGQHNSGGWLLHCHCKIPGVNDVLLHVLIPGCLCLLSTAERY